MKLFTRKVHIYDAGLAEKHDRNYPGDKIVALCGVRRRVPKIKVSEAEAKRRGVCEVCKRHAGVESSAAFIKVVGPITSWTYQPEKS